MRAGRRRRRNPRYSSSWPWITIDPPVRKQVRRIVVPGMQMTITNRRQVFGTIDIRRQLIGNLLFEGPAHGSCGVGLERPVVTGAMRQCPWRDEGR